MTSKKIKSSSKKGRIGQPPHEPTETTRKQVESMAGYGVPLNQVAVLIGITEKTLYKYYRKEIDTGKAKANSQVGLTLFQQIKAGNTSAAIWWTKSQMGWKDQSRVEIANAEGEAFKVAPIVMKAVSVTDPCASGSIKDPLAKE